MKGYILFLIISLSSILSCCAQNKEPFKGKQIELIASDGLKITADLYDLENKQAPVILLFHQAGYSRGEYRETAPKLNKLGFRCLAIDARSGKEVNGVENETFKRATAQGKNTKYIDAISDLEAAIKYAKEELKASKIIICGSSYSASLVIYLAGKYKNDISGVLAFSPGEYFSIEGETFADYAAKVTCPVFITSAKGEQSSWQAIYDAVPGVKYSYLPETTGFHGSRALWSSKEGNEKVWEAVEKFLKTLN